MPLDAREGKKFMMVIVIEFDKGENQMMNLLLYIVSTIFIFFSIVYLTLLITIYIWNKIYLVLESLIDKVNGLTKSKYLEIFFIGIAVMILCFCFVIILSIISKFILYAVQIILSFS